MCVRVRKESLWKTSFPLTALQRTQVAKTYLCVTGYMVCVPTQPDKMASSSTPAGVFAVLLPKAIQTATAKHKAETIQFVVSLPVVKHLTFNKFKKMMKTSDIPPEAIQGVWDTLLAKAVGGVLEGEHYTCMWGDEGEDHDVEGVVDEFITEQAEECVSDVMEGLKPESESETE